MKTPGRPTAVHYQTTGTTSSTSTSTNGITSTSTSGRTNGNNTEQRLPWRKDAPHVRWLPWLQQRRRTLVTLAVAVPLNAALVYVALKALDPEAKDNVQTQVQAHMRPAIPGDPDQPQNYSHIRS